MLQAFVYHRQIEKILRRNFGCDESRPFHLDPSPSRSNFPPERRFLNFSSDEGKFKMAGSDWLPNHCHFVLNILIQNAFYTAFSYFVKSNFRETNSACKRKPPWIMPSTFSPLNSSQRNFTRMLGPFYLFYANFIQRLHIMYLTILIIQYWNKTL